MAPIVISDVGTLGESAMIFLGHKAANQENELPFQEMSHVLNRGVQTIGLAATARGAIACVKRT